MKLTFHKNLEHHLVKNGFQVFFKCSKSDDKRTYLSYNNFEIYIFYEQKIIEIQYRSFHSPYEIKGCKTLNDLYRLEKLIEGTTNQNQNQ